MSAAKSTFCEAFNAVYCEELVVAPNEDGLVYKITAAPPKYTCTIFQGSNKLPDQSEIEDKLRVMWGDIEKTRNVKTT